MKPELVKEVTGVPVAFYMDEHEKHPCAHYIVLDKIARVSDYRKLNNSVVLYLTGDRDFIKLTGQEAEDFMGYWKSYVAY